MKRGEQLEYAEDHARIALYRPFTTRYLYFDPAIVERRYLIPSFFPNVQSEAENRALVLSDIPFRSPYACFLVSRIPDVHLCSSDAFQVFPFYTYAEDGTQRRENVTDWALKQFRTHYADSSITKWDIFHYIYAVLHHPDYRERYAADLRRELPHIPFAIRFHLMAEAGKQLAEMHVNYEKQPEYPLTKVEKIGAKLDYRVTKMRLSKDKASLIYNEFLTLTGIPPDVDEYRLGNRSALEWVVDQYQVSTDKRSDMPNDPNRPDDPTYILRLIGKVVTISLRTMEIVQALGPMKLSGTMQDGG